MHIGKGGFPSPRRLSMRMEPRRRRYVVTALLFALMFFLYSHSNSSLSYRAAFYSNLGSYLDLPANIEPANATLGFGAIVAVSQITSPRRKSLLVAASITELNITIPDQPLYTDKDVSNLRQAEYSVITRGSALAWLGHLHVLRWFLDTDLETVLILEDDVDWDIHLRTQQVPKVAAAARTLLTQEQNMLRHKSKQLEQHSFISPEIAGGYWGDTSGAASWDIMYLGHCGDIFSEAEWTNTTQGGYIPRASFPDNTMPPRDDLHRYTKAFFDNLHVPEHTRLVHKSVAPLCTFGFALTRNAAKKLLYDIAPRETVGGCVAYDVRILEACRDLGFRCWSSNPELFHHQDRPSMIASIDTTFDRDKKSKEQLENEEDDHDRWWREQDAIRKQLSEADRKRLDDDRDQREQREREEEKAEIERAKSAIPGVDAEGRLEGAAPNIECGVRSTSMYTEDPATLEWLIEVVGHQGKCLRDEMAEAMSKWP